MKSFGWLQINIYWMMAAWLLLGCSPLGETPVAPEIVTVTGESPLDLTRLIEKLRGSGASVTPAGEFHSGELGGEGRVITVNGHDVQIYEYGDEAAARLAASYISLDGGQFNVPDAADPSIRTVSIVEWIATPHFYRAGRLIVQYIGDDLELIALLEQVLSPQFAGGTSSAELPLITIILEPALGTPMTFEEAAGQAEAVVLAKVLDADPGPAFVSVGEPPRCAPSFLVSVQIAQVYKGDLAPNEVVRLYQPDTGATDMDTGCGDNSAAERAFVIMDHDPLYDPGQRYLLAIASLPKAYRQTPDLASRDLHAVLVNGRLLVEQGGHARFENSDVVHVAYDGRGRAVPGEPTGFSLAEFEALMSSWFE